jgi:AcrR family transcriptional regulator
MPDRPPTPPPGRAALPPLPIAAPRAERGDAAANRRRILDAAARLLAEHGPAALTMDAVAVAAGVGKGTVFRRFGDRTGLTEALVSGYLQEFQDAFLAGPPPLGPGAPPAERLEAFLTGLVRLQRRHLPLALAAELAGRPAERSAFGALELHVRVLLEAIDPAFDAPRLAVMLLGAVGAGVLEQADDADDAAATAAVLALLRGVTAPRSPVRRPNARS